MQEIIIEVMIGIVILMLLGIVIIPLYNQVQTTINSLLYQSPSRDLEKSLFGLVDGTDHTGAEVIAQVDYFSSFSNRIVTVVKQGQSISYIDSLYDAGEFPIQLHERYTFSESRDSGYMEYIYTLKN